MPVWDRKFSADATCLTANPRYAQRGLTQGLRKVDINKVDINKDVV